MYKDKLYNEYKHRCDISIKALMLFGAILIILSLVNFFGPKPLSYEAYSVFIIFCIAVFVLSEYQNFIKLRAISRDNYNATIVTCLKTSHNWARKRRYSKYYCYYTTPDYAIRRARITRHDYYSIRQGDRVLLVTFDGESKLLFLHDEIFPLN